MTENSKVSFNINYLKESALNLAEIHSGAKPVKKFRPVKPILEDSKKVLNNAYRILAGLAKQNQDLSPAAEWLIDNFYIVQEQIVQVGVDFPKEYQKSVPALISGEHEGLPRVYELIMNFLTHTDNRVDEEVLVQYIHSYQQAETLMQGEIWAIPIMIRLTLVQKLSEKASRLLDRKKTWREVHDLMNSLDNRDLQEPGVLVNIISNWLKSKNSEQSDLQRLIELYNQLQLSGMLLEEQKRWFSYRFKKHDTTIEDAMRIEAQMQSRLQVSIQNAVITLRESAETDWSDFAEQCSLVEQILRLDPSGYYQEMDFQTRDGYRRTVERLSRRSGYSETEIAEQALIRAEEETGDTGGSAEDILMNRNVVKTHIGYSLAGEGYRQFAKSIGYRMPLMERVRLKLERQSAWYLLAIIVHTIVLMVILWFVTDAIREFPIISITVLLVALFPALDLSVSAVNRFFAFVLPPRKLPKMDYREYIPDHSRTVVVVPTMFSSPDDVRKQAEKLEVRSLANPHPGLQYVLLSDFLDADHRQMEGDQEIIETAKKVIQELNEKYRSRFGDKFFLLHRERILNESEEVWMGWERKRGKLEEFNLLLNDPNAETSYKFILGDFFESIRKQPVKFVITLDADTQLPPDSAVNLIRTISHPLNRAWYDPDKKRITKGYAIIQPRISIPPASARKTWFSRIFSGNVGLDPYSTAVSDIYQDLTGEAVFTGKGIYDSEAFHEVLHKRFPENRILSHDLIESAYLRTGLATDIELFDDYPSTYVSFNKRNHRWTRGDWQIAAWLFPSVPGPDGKEKNRINLLSRWKIFDNLRRSLNPFFLSLFFIAGWFLLPGSAWIWTLAALGILAFPIYVSLSSDLLNRPARVRWKLYWDKVRSNLRMNTVQSLLTVIVLPHQAWVHLDAIIRSLYRLRFSKKRLLEWSTASQVESNSPHSPGAYIKMMFISVILGVSILLGALWTNLQYLWVVIPFFILWTGAPLYLWVTSQPVKSGRKPYREEDLLKLRGYARRTWFYFERFVNEDNSWLPPDNYQVDPPLPPADRTSPTNIGLSLVSTQTAYNMGYITYSEYLGRLQNTFQSLEKLERYKGHFYNWYQTTLGEVLSPKYISTVDSGNLAACLITIKEAVKASTGIRINKNYRSGLVDTVNTVKNIFEQFEEDELLSDPCYNQICVFTGSMLDTLNDHNLTGINLLRSLKEDASKLSSIDLMPLGSRFDDQYMQDLLFWIGSPLNQIEKGIAEWKCLSISEDVEAGSFTPDELNSVMQQRENNSQCILLLNRWEKQVDNIISISESLIEEMDFSFLYLKRRGLFSIGYFVEKSQLDKVTYDLLASEARIASYIAIAKGDIPVEHWFRLSRRLTSLNQNEILLSWGGTMFEYLMPLLFMRTFPDTLINHTYQSVVRWQREYGRKQNRPWGQSESAYYFLNIDLHYQYRAFGAPGLGLKRGLAEEYVVAPYASLLSLMIDPNSSIENLSRLEQAGGTGLYGFFDALDYTPSRLQSKESHKVVKTYMAHHHGMGLIAMENVLNNWSIHDYFHADLSIRGCELILQERVPRGVPIKEPHPIDVELEPGEQEAIQSIVEHAGMHELDASPPRMHILSNGNYSTFMTHAGTGGSRYNGLAMNGWDPDPAVDPLGFFFYIKDTDSGEYWSAMHQPVKRKPDRYDTWFHNGKSVTSRVDEWIETTTEASVSPDHAMEFRKLTLTNYSDKKRTLEVTSYAEVVLNRPEDHHSHPAFSKLFVQTDYLAEYHSIVAKRRPRNDREQEVWLVHTFAGEDDDNNLTEPLQYETERSKFIGRGRSLSNPLAMEMNINLEGALGNVSDPIVSLRKQIVIEPGEKVECSFGLGFAGSYEEAVQLADIYDNQYAVHRALDLATVYSSVELSHIGINSKQAHYFQQLASYLVYSDRRFRTDEQTLRDNRKKQQDLWAYGISGDLPLVVFRINHTDQLKQVKSLLQAHAFWRLKGLQSELLILNDHGPSYADAVQEAVQNTIESSTERGLMYKYGGVFIHRSDKIQREDLTLLLSVAHVVFDRKLPDSTTLKQQMPMETSWYLNSGTDKNKPPEIGDTESGEVDFDENNLEYFNSFGGFGDGGREYQILIKINRETGRHEFPPAPWVNVIANPDFGFIATERGAGYTWSENSRENKLTAWSNDPVVDPHSEAFYLRDNKAKTFWSPAPGPAPGNGSYRVTHGYGYTTYNHKSGDLDQELTQFVPLNEPIKISRLTITNEGKDIRKLSVFRYTDRVLGIDRNTSSRHIISRSSDNGRTLFARNSYNNEFAGRSVFSHVATGETEPDVSFTTDRVSFIGRNRSLDRPAALCSDQKLDNRIADGGDPCAAFQIDLSVPRGESVTLLFLDGETVSIEHSERVISEYAALARVESLLGEVKAFWEKKLSRIRVTTPDKSLDLMVNGWLMYQNLSSRMWGRTAYYQAGGAFGFRDQLQDSMATLYVDPELTRKQILLHASKQFVEGDVLHWWHPPTGRGIRSKITDDRLWLPFVTEKYFRVTGEESILEEEVSYITARPLEEEEHEVYLHPQTMSKRGSLYEHCCKAIDISLKFGNHGLPLIGAGDWNDGMNRVGEQGRGESVWLGFFIYITLVRFQKVCRMMGDDTTADRYKSEAAELKKNLNREGWDGKWYLRAFYDDGTPLGSSSNDECKIDAISQAWAVLSGVAGKKRALKSLNSAETHLISVQDKIIRLLTPPFDKTEKNPGYIKGYIPGVRENGGQYTHGALWVIKAMAELGMGEKAVQYMNMINPVNHGSSREMSLQYKVEPYVVAADVYGEPPLNGMGGWTWYTGSGGWMYRVMLESILGFRIEQGQIILEPAISGKWPEYRISLKADDSGTEYHITIMNPDGLESGVLSGSIDGREVRFKHRYAKIEILNDGQHHQVLLNIKAESDG